jgi:hypothetical protein
VETSALIAIKLMKLQAFKTGTQTGIVVPVKGFVGMILQRSCNVYTLIF